MSKKKILKPKWNKEQEKEYSRLMKKLYKTAGELEFFLNDNTDDRIPKIDDLISEMIMEPIEREYLDGYSEDITEFLNEYGR